MPTTSDLHAQNAQISQAPPLEPVTQLDSLFESPDETTSKPDIELFIADPVLDAGTDSTVEVTILNTGEITEGTTLDQETATARGVRLTVDDDDAPVTVDSGETTAGSIPPGELATVPISVTAPASADGDSGDFTVEVSYTYTSFDDDGNARDETETDSFDIELEVGSRSQFEISDVETTAQVGTDGTVDVDLENIGSDDAEAVRITAQSPTGGVTIGSGNGGAATEPPRSDDSSENGAQPPATDADEPSSSGTASSAAFVGDLDSGDTETASFDTRIDQDFGVERYLLELTVVYEDGDGILRESSTLATAVEPIGGQTFELDAVDSTLAVGEQGTITATLENTGPEAVETPVVRVEPASERIDIGDSRVAIDDLDDGESTEISFDAEVSGQADPGPRQVTFTVEYGLRGDRLESDPFVERVDVADEQRAFTITADDAEIPAGTTQTVEVTVTNNRPERLSNLNVFLYPDGPLSVDSDEAFIAELEAGDTETVSVDIAVDEDANQRAYPLGVDIRYDDERNDDRISQVYQVPITAAEPPPDNSLLPSFVSLAGVAALLMGTAAVLRRRQ